MASTFTTNLNLEKPGIGEQDGDWGATLNSNFDGLDTAIASKVSASGTATLTNKTIDADNNTISNLEVDNLKSGVLDTDISSVSGSDDTLASAKSIKTYVDAQDSAIASDTLTFTNKTFDVEGTGNSISNIDVADLKSGVLDTDISSVSGSDDTLASAKAIKTYVDAQIATKDNTDEITEGSTNLYFTNARAQAVSINELSEDTSPQLGGNLDVNGQDIVTTSNADIELAPNGTGKTILKGNTNPGTLVFNCENNSHGQTVKAQPHLSSVTNVLTLPPGGDQEIAGTTATQTFTNKTLTSAVLNTGVSGTAILDEDNMASNSATQLATQQSIKAYVDSEVSGAGGGAANAFKTISVSGQDDVVADSATDTLTFVAGSNMTITTDASGDQITFASSGGSSSPALDDISLGDAASTLATSSGNITIDAQGNDTDIIFKGTDGGADTTFLTLDGSDAGTATFNHDLNLSNSAAYINHRGAHFNASYGYNFLTYAGIIFKSTVSNTGVPMNFLNSAGTSVGYISTNNSNTAYVTFSDYRLKNNVVDITDGITRLKQLQPRRFNFKDTPTQDGFLAHEVTATVPEAVTGEKDGMIDTGTLKDKDGNIIGTEQEKPKDLHVTGFTFEKTGETEEYQGMDLAKLVPLLTAALQEAVTKIEALETRVTTLEG